MKAYKLTSKLLQGARLVANEFDCTIQEAVEAYGRDGIYEWCIANGYTWNAKLQAWTFRANGKDITPAKNYTPVQAQIRVMCHDTLEAEIVTKRIAEVLKLSGVEIVQQSTIKKNYDGDGGRAYLTILI